MPPLRLQTGQYAQCTSLRLHLAQKSPWQHPDQVPHLSQRSKVQRLDGYYFFRICLFQKVTHNAASEAANRSVCSVHLTEATLGSEIPMATARVCRDEIRSIRSDTSRI